jgi:hypothetical protein
MKNYIKLFTASTLLILSSCSNDFLDTAPVTEKVSENFYKTPKDAFEGLISIYDVLQQEGGWAGFQMITEEASDNCFGGFGTADGIAVLDWDRFKNSSDPEMNNVVWQSCYKGIYRANILLENLDKVNWGTDTALKAKYEAEARFLRAHFHFELARIFGDIVPLDHSINTSEFNSPRLAPEVTYALIANDLKFAVENLGTENYSQVGNTNYGRITKWAAESYLAKAFIFYTDYYTKPDLAGVVTKAQAVTYINDVVNNSGHALITDYSRLWIAASLANYAGEGNTEMVWAIRYNGSGKGDWNLHEGNRLSVLIAPRGGNIGRYAYGWGGLPVTPSLYGAYEVGDTRRDATIINFAGEGLNFDPAPNKRDQRQYTGYAWKKYCPVTNEAGIADVTANGGNFQIDNVEDYAVIRFSDVLLMAAELNLGTNDAFAKTCLDRVRDRAFQNASHRVAATLPNIMKERQLELALEGQRFFDLIRQSPAVAKAAIDNVNNSDSQFNVTFRTETLGWFAIPQSQIVLSNGAIKQNPGW